MNKLCCPVNITIEQNWDSIRALYRTVFDKQKLGKLDHDLIEVDEWGGTQYNLDRHGSLMLSQRLSPNWGSLSGPILNRLLPWHKQVVEIFKPLNFGMVIWSDTIADVTRHVDAKISEEYSLPQCKINYIVSSEDQLAKTIVYDSNEDSYYESYPSTLNHAWLLNTSHPHEIWSKGHREILQFKFFNHYDDVADFLKQVGPITLK